MKKKIKNIFILLKIKKISVADLPGLIPDSHKNRGLGIEFLKHVERCFILAFVLDMSLEEPWEHLTILQYELSKFNENFKKRPQLIIANKMDLPDSESNLEYLRSKVNVPIIPISAKFGDNLRSLLKEIRIMYDKNICVT